MKKVAKNVSPFLLLTVPFFVLLGMLAIHSGNELILEKIQFSVAFFKIPDIDVWRVLLLIVGR